MPTRWSGLLRINPDARSDEVTGEELREMIGEHEDFTPEERRVLTDVFTATDRVLREVMIPRTEVEFLPGSMPLREAADYVTDRVRVTPTPPPARPGH